MENILKEAKIIKILVKNNKTVYIRSSSQRKVLLMLTMNQLYIKHILLKIPEMGTQENIDYLIEIATHKKEEQFLEIAKKSQPRTKEELNEIMKSLKIIETL